MQVHRTTNAARAWVGEQQRSGKRVALVPTMGALHRGHISLVQAARAQCETVALTIFVNPTQFGPQEDFSSYPRPLEKDLQLCAGAGVDLVFTPEVETMYPPDAAITVRVARLTDGLCGPHRPGHFDGVATVVAKLFHIIPADAAYFGEKDYQQLQVIRRMVHDLHLKIEIVGCPTIREPDGLALSSRNAYLNADQRRQAQSLSRALFNAAQRVEGGALDSPSLVREMRDVILAAGPATIDYIAIVDPDTLEPMAIVDRPARICLAVRIGACRLIDNLAVDPAPLR